MNRAYAVRLLQEGRLPCLVITIILFTLNLALSQVDSHPQLFKMQEGNLRGSSLSEFAFGLVVLALPCLVLILSWRGLAAELGRGTLAYLATQSPSRRTLVFTLWIIRALQIAAVLSVSLLPFLLRLSFPVVLGAFFWAFTSAYLSFVLIETLGMLMKSFWLAVLAVFPGVWAAQVVFSILSRARHWNALDPINYVLSEWLFRPILLGASSDLARSIGVTVCWLLFFLVLAILSGEWLEHIEIRPWLAM
ncbi:MAG: hypothetical protein ACM3SW_05280 [Actinomycetota bacterium]